VRLLHSLPVRESPFALPPKKNSRNVQGRVEHVRLLILAASYPHPGHLFAGIFNERSVLALGEICDGVEVLAPRPYVPPLLSAFVPRWKDYAQIVPYEVRSGVRVYRPAYLQPPRLGGAFWIDPGIFFWCRRVARDMHRRAHFDAIISFDLFVVGGFAWRIGRELGIPASGWATGGDIRVSSSSSHGRAVIQTLERLDLVFYQSHELLEKAASLLGKFPSQMSSDRHVVLPRGIPASPLSRDIATRSRVRMEWGITGNQVVVLNIGRISREKGVFELLKAFSLAAGRNSNISCVLVGSKPTFDETSVVREKLAETPALKKRVKILPACNPDKIWEYLCAADIFAFASHKEGMPNSLLEAMAAGVPAVAFAIPPVLEIEAGTGALLAVPPLNSALFSKAILRLAASPEDRVRIAKIGRAQIMDRFMVRKNMAEVLRRLESNQRHLHCR